MTAPLRPLCRIVNAGDAAIIAQLENRIDPVVNAHAIALGDAVRRAAVAGVRDVVTTFRSVAVHFEPLTTDYAALVRTVEDLAAAPLEHAEANRPPHEVPVVYGGSFGPDLTAAAAHAGVSEAEAIAIHTGRTYRVFMLGFMPGYAYMSEVDARLALPRLAVPRLMVAAGSVAIAGTLTGIYPFDAPGGWRIIGRTPVKPYDPNSVDPFLFKAGDRVRFVPVDRWPA